MRERERERERESESQRLRNEDDGDYHLLIPLNLERESTRVADKPRT
jgi:hypothetical protein